MPRVHQDELIGVHVFLGNNYVTSLFRKDKKYHDGRLPGKTKISLQRYQHVIVIVMSLLLYGIVSNNLYVLYLDKEMKHGEEYFGNSLPKIEKFLQA